MGWQGIPEIRAKISKWIVSVFIRVKHWLQQSALISQIKIWFRSNEQFIRNEKYDVHRKMIQLFSFSQKGNVILYNGKRVLLKKGCFIRLGRWGMASSGVANDDGNTSRFQYRIRPLLLAYNAVASLLNQWQSSCRMKAALQIIFNNASSL